MSALEWAAGFVYVAVYMATALETWSRIEDAEPIRPSIVNMVSASCVALFWPLWMPVWAMREAFRRPAGRHHRSIPIDAEERSC